MYASPKPSNSLSRVTPLCKIEPTQIIERCRVTTISKLLMNLEGFFPVSPFQRATKLIFKSWFGPVLIYCQVTTCYRFSSLGLESVEGDAFAYPS